jgi:hypothetical protein
LCELDVCTLIGREDEHVLCSLGKMRGNLARDKVCESRVRSCFSTDDCLLGDATMLCIPCYKKTHGNGSDINAAASTDRVNLAAPTASSKKKAAPDPDLLKNLYNLDELEARSKEHNNILALLVNHCGGTDEAVSRIPRVKARVEKKNNLDKFCYDSDAEADADPPCSQSDLSYLSQSNNVI